MELSKSCAYNGYGEVALLLLNHGANIHAQNQSQYIPLYFAEKYDRREVAQLLRDWPYYKRFRRECLVAFCMAQHSRLGQNSPARVLPENCRREIAQHVVAEWANHTIDRVHDMAEQEREIEIERNQQRTGNERHGQVELHQPTTNSLRQFLLGAGGVATAAMLAVITYQLLRR